jgi:hypothetical protein
MGIEDDVEARSVGATRQPIEAVAQAGGAARLDEGQQEQDDDRQGEPDEGRSGVGLDQGVEIDRAVPPDRASAADAPGGPSLAGRTGRFGARQDARAATLSPPSAADDILRPDPRSPRSHHRPMAKRSRLTARPGQRRPLQRAGRVESGSTRDPGKVTALEEARAAELEAAIIAEEQAAETARRNRERGRRTTVDASGGVSYVSVPLAVRASEEYGYVKRDIRRITLVGGFLLAILAVLEVLVNGMHLFTL